MRDRASKLLGAIFALIAVLVAYILIHDPVGEDAMHRAAPLLRTFLPGPLLRANHGVAASARLQKIASSSPATASASNFISSSSSRPFSQTLSVAMGSDKLSFSDAVKHRRTIYNLTKKSTISDDRLKEIVTQAIHDVPSSFNSQSTRLVVLVKEKHDQYWQIVEDILKAIVPAEQWEHTAGRLNGFKNAYGTILFYEDPEPIRQLQSKFAIYADKFPDWSEHTSAMHQYELWTALEAEGLGANLQHYNPLPDQKVSEVFGVPLEWSHKAQLVFGTPAEGAREALAEKNQEDVEKRLFFHGF